jgi:hypothetical protein
VCRRWCFGRRSQTASLRQIDSLTARPAAAAASSLQVRFMSYFGTLSAIATVVTRSDPKTTAENRIDILFSWRQQLP